MGEVFPRGVCAHEASLEGDLQSGGGQSIINDLSFCQVVFLQRSSGVQNLRALEWHSYLLEGS